MRFPAALAEVLCWRKLLPHYRRSRGLFRRLRYYSAEGLRAPPCEIPIIGVPGQSVLKQRFSQALPEVRLQPGCIRVKQQQWRSLEAALRCQLGLSGLGGGAFPLHLALLLLLLGVLALSVHRCRRKRQLCLQNFKGIVRGQCEGQSTI